MRADIEVRKGRALCPSTPAVLLKTLPGEKRSLPGQVLPDEIVRRQGLFEIFQACVSNTHFRVHDRIDDNRSVRRGSAEHCAGPVAPFLVLIQIVDQNVAVDERGLQSSPRVIAINWSVVMPGIGFGARRIASSMRSPRLFRLFPRALRIRTLSPASSNSTSLFACSPRFS